MAAVVAEDRAKPDGQQGVFEPTAGEWRHMTFAGRESTAIEQAAASDVEAIKAMVVAAYTKYIERIGKRPAPMNADYEAFAKSGDLYVLRVDGTTVGAIHVARADDSLSIGNLVVAPEWQGHGLGRMLIGFAEDMARSLTSPALTLYTNEMMHENIAHYTKIGFIETARRTVDGYNRVYFRKQLQE
ncbi:N-acetyltransferase [Burkholderia stabilis]|uniref:N-acetyltransferase n=2 Tax=Burkholderia stabilis TaxID=95485 RepID=A0A4Q2AJI4_9BURK|nr:N-acetyltransferase [Burkholderia stabilis]